MFRHPSTTPCLKTPTSTKHRRPLRVVEDLVSIEEYANVFLNDVSTSNMGPSENGNVHDADQPWVTSGV